MTFFLFFAIVTLVAWNIVKANNKRLEESWKQSADESGLDYSSGSLGKSPEISGYRRGYRVKSLNYRTGPSAADRVTGFLVKFREPFSICFQIERATDPVNSHGSVVSSGDAAFDRKYRIFSGNESAVRDLLNVERKRVINNLFEAFDHVEVSHQSLSAGFRGVEKDPTRLSRILNRVVDFAMNIEQANSEVQPPPLPEPPALPAEETRIEKEEVIAVETLPVIETPEKLEVYDVELELAEEIEESDAEEPPLPEVVPAEATPDRVIEDDTLSLNEVSRALFVDTNGRSRFDTGRLFSTDYEGEVISGAGRLVRADRFSSDLVFGRGPGGITTIEMMIESDEDETISPKKVQVLFAVDIEELADWKSRLGQEVRVRGVAKKCDVFATKLFISDVA